MLNSAHQVLKLVGCISRKVEFSIAAGHPSLLFAMGIGDVERLQGLVGHLVSPFLQYVLRLAEETMTAS